MHHNHHVRAHEAAHTDDIGVRYCGRVLAKDYPDGDAALKAQRAYVQFKERLLTLDSVALVRVPTRACLMPVGWTVRLQRVLTPVAPSVRAGCVPVRGW